MPSLQLRDVPPELYHRIADLARREHRSLTQQAVILLARALDVSEDPVRRRRRLLDAVSGRPLVASLDGVPPPEALVWEDRKG
ncbi:MAG TPA: hypothetical protein VLE22_19495 [Bryobacteraceae bacterium]|nr:hypothetical protein [Bryobacteraceae bacterium]